MKAIQFRMLGLAAGLSAALLSMPSMAQNADALKADAKSPGDVLTYGMGYNAQRYSTLTQINRGNVAKLAPAWNLSLDNSANASTQPLFYNGVLYVASHNATTAIDVETGMQKWKTPVELPADVNAMVCCGVHTRGLAIYDGVIYRVTLDNHVIGLNAADGKVVFNTATVDYKQGYSMTGAPLVANGVVMVGVSGAEYHTRGFIKGFDPKTGKELWTRYTTAAPNEPGGETWGDKESYKNGGGSTWITGSYDPDLDLVYWGTGNGAPWNPQMRGAGGDSLYICSVLAIKPKTGEIAWHFQFSPADPYDYDSVNEIIVADIKMGNKPVKALLQANRNGFYYVLDRANGKLLAANQYAKKLNWASGVDMKTGRPIDTEMTKRFKTQMEMAKGEEVWPNVFGAKNWQPTSYDPKRQVVYANTLNFGWKIRNTKQEIKLPQMFIGMDIEAFVEPGDGNRGALQAIDPLTGKAKWDVPLKVPHWSGIMSTAGDLVFTGNLMGEFMAFDADNGHKLWGFRTGSGIVSMPITYEWKGKQYVTLTSGGATVYGALGGDPNLPAVPAGSSVWTFALK
jgi:alcohol dehydrogenase (cytochrome c)